MFKPDIHLPLNIKRTKPNNNLITNIKNNSVSLLEWFGIDTQRGDNSLVLSQAGNWITTTGTQKVVNLTSQQLLNLNTSPVELIEAPGENKIIVVDKVILVYYFGTVAYTQPGNTNVICGSNNIIQLGTNLASSTDKILQSFPQTVTLTENTNLELYNTTANMTDGDGTAKLYIYYSINEI